MLLIVLSSEFFTNGIEWLGQRYRISEGVVGSVFAAIGTALPETMVPIVAVLLFGESAGNEVSVGAITGSPFMLTTLTIGLCGLSIFIFSRTNRRKLDLNLDESVLKRDLSFFLVVFSIVFIASFTPEERLFRIVLGCLIILVYPVYLYRSFRAEGSVGEEPDKLYLARFFNKESLSGLLIAMQIFLSVAGIICGAYFFVEKIQVISIWLGIPPQVLSIVISPIATEFPEKMNSILWLRKGKDTLALGNVTGALVFQGTILGGFGVAFTKWNLSEDARVCSLVAIASAMAFLLLLKKGKLSYKFLMLGIFVYVVAILKFLVIG